MTPFQERLGRFTVQTMTGLNNVVYRLSKGRVAGQIPTGAPICLVTTVGRHTSRRRTVSLVYLADGDDIAVVASRGGMSSHPAWFLNLLADPDVVVESGGETWKASARVASNDEKDRLWPALVGMYAHFAAYQIRTDRSIPVVILSPRHD
jgi:deazaflavin-dependent oxidoreductase (nitroreductase family)